jgi:biopolymer transport protein ExbD
MMERAWGTEAIREALARGDLHDDDLFRPAGTSTPWARLVDFPATVEPPAGVEARAEPDADDFRSAAFADDFDLPGDEDAPETLDVLLDEDEDQDQADTEAEAEAEEKVASTLELPSVDAIRWEEGQLEEVEEEEEEFDPLDEDEEAAEFTLSRGDPERVEELDLAAMVDVAFQLVLFFLVTATTVLYKSLEIPKPNPESPAAGATQGKAHTLNDLKNDYILVEIDPEGAMKIDREPVPSEMPALVERLRSAREATGRKAMLLSADFTTPHRSAVLAYDAANEIGLGIAIARPTPRK